MSLPALARDYDASHAGIGRLVRLSTTMEYAVRNWTDDRLDH
jgi:hypothetical protein